LEKTLVQTHSSPTAQHYSSSHLIRPVCLILSRPPTRGSVKAIWDGFRINGAWGEAIETYDLNHE